MSIAISACQSSLAKQKIAKALNQKHRQVGKLNNNNKQSHHHSHHSQIKANSMVGSDKFGIKLVPESQLLKFHPTIEIKFFNIKK